MNNAVVNQTEQSKLKSVLWIIVAYLLCIGSALAYLYLDFFSALRAESLLLNTFIADTIATIVIFVFSRFFKNSSFYDAYWSVIPPLIFHYWVIEFNLSLFSVEVLLTGLVIWAWAIRLTYNWTVNWAGLHHEDWRYIMLKEKMPKIEMFTDFFGIHFFPTCQVFLGLIPVYILFSSDTLITPLFYLGVFLGFSAFFIQMIADKQLHDFINQNSSKKIIQQGLWAYSRHPNYFAEVLFWFALAIIGCSAALTNEFNFVGFLAMYLMFRFVSIPMMEKRSLSRRPEYQQVLDSISMLLPLPRKNKN